MSTSRRQEGHGRILSLEPSVRAWLCRYLEFRSLAYIQNWGPIDFCCLKLPSLWYFFLWLTQETNHYSLVLLLRPEKLRNNFLSILHTATELSISSDYHFFGSTVSSKLQIRLHCFPDPLPQDSASSEVGRNVVLKGITDPQQITSRLKILLNSMLKCTFCNYILPFLLLCFF